MRYHLFQKFFAKLVIMKEMYLLSTKGMTWMFGNCRFSLHRSTLVPERTQEGHNYFEKLFNLAQGK